MSLDKAIKNGKEHRKPFRARACAAVYGGRGKCSYCSSGRVMKDKASEKDYKDQIKESE